MSRIYLGSFLIIFGSLLLFNMAGIINPDIYWNFLKLFQKYWPGLLILLGLRMIIAGKNPGWAEALKWLIILLVGLWIFCVFFAARNWVI